MPEEEQAELQDCVNAIEELNERMLEFEQRLNEVKNDLTSLWSGVIIRLNRLEERIGGAL